MPDLPPQMVEAAARDWWERARVDDFDPPTWDELDEPRRNNIRDHVRPILAAALSVCEVREQEGLRLDWVDGHGGQSEDWENNRSGWARNAVRLHHAAVATNPDYPARASLIHRLVITTPAEEADRA